MARYADHLTEQVWDAGAADSLFRRAAQVVDDAAAGDFHRDKIRTQPFTEQVRNLCEEQRRA